MRRSEDDLVSFRGGERVGRLEKTEKEAEVGEGEGVRHTARKK